MRAHFGLPISRFRRVDEAGGGAMSGRKTGGEGGIRTPDTRQGMAAFEAARFNHSRTSPRETTRSDS